MILLGAGASKVFGLPTLQDLTNNLTELMENKGYKDLMLEIIGALKKFDIQPDFENVYSTIEALANPQDYIGKGNGVIAYFAYKANLSNTTNPDFVNILTDMKDLVYKKCTLPKFTSTHQKIFDNLMKACAIGEVRNVGGQERILDRGQQTIVTTNYDTIVELYDYSKNIKLVTGFGSEKEESRYWHHLT